MTYIFVPNSNNMKKKTPKAYSLPSENDVKNTSAEPYVGYGFSIPKPQTRKPLVKDFLYKDFRKIADIAPFTIAEWASILHISERTLHRYAKENADFNGMQVERILLIEKMVSIGNQLFTKEAFKEWIHSTPFSLAPNTPLELLTTYEGIQEATNVLGRMQHGISA